MDLHMVDPHQQIPFQSEAMNLVIHGNLDPLVILDHRPHDRDVIHMPLLTTSWILDDLNCVWPWSDNIISNQTNMAGIRTSSTFLWWHDFQCDRESQRTIAQVIDDRDRRSDNGMRSKKKNLSLYSVIKDTRR